MQDPKHDDPRKDGKTHEKPMLTVEEQIAHMKAKGIKFDLCSEEDAAIYLEDRNNFFKLASYRKLFPKHVGGKHDGMYADLDFAYLVDLASIDRQLRYTMLPLTLDIEHAAKVKLLKKLSENESEDGYSIVQDFLASKSDRRREYIEEDVSRMEHDPYCGAVARKYRREMPAWALLEICSFGIFSNFYLFCALRWGDSRMRSEHYLLKSCKGLRNASAHSSNILSALGTRDSHLPTDPTAANALKGLGIGKAQRKTKLSNIALHQITETLFTYRELVKNPSSRERASKSLQDLVSRMKASESYYVKNETITSSFAYIEKLIEGWFRA